MPHRSTKQMRGRQRLHQFSCVLLCRDSPESGGITIPVWEFALDKAGRPASTYREGTIVGRHWPGASRLILVAIACPPGAQIGRFGIRVDKLYVKEKSCRNHELPAAKVDRNSLHLSPDGRRLIYHLEFAGYGHDSRIPVKVWSADQPGRLAEFQLPTRCRILNFVEWVDARRVLIGGDRSGVVLDVDKGVVARKIPGNCFPSRRTGTRSRAGRGAPSACPSLCRTG